MNTIHPNTSAAELPAASAAIPTEDGPLLQSLKQSTGYYLSRIDALDLEQLRRQPDPEEWSLGQMLMHLAGSALYMQLANVQRCLETAENPAEESMPKTEIARSVFLSGSFPPAPVRVPASPQYTPQQPESKAQIVTGLERVLETVRELEPRVAASSSRRTAPHPRFGGLNAAEWLKLTEMHYRHHRLQEARLSAWLQSVD